MNITLTDFLVRDAIRRASDAVEFIHPPAVVEIDGEQVSITFKGGTPVVAAHITNSRHLDNLARIAVIRAIRLREHQL